MTSVWIVLTVSIVFDVQTVPTALTVSIVSIVLIAPGLLVVGVLTEGTKMTISDLLSMSDAEIAEHPIPLVATPVRDDCTDCFGCRLCRLCEHCVNCLDCFHCIDCYDCSECAGCNDCTRCRGLIDASYMIADRQFSEKLYRKAILMIDF